MKTDKGKRQMREVLKANFDLDRHQSDSGTFRGVASVFEQMIDAHIPSVIHRGAFKKTLKENRGRVRILWQHDDSEPIGLPTSMRETDTGLEIEGRISDTARGRDALTLMRDGVVTDLSIGFDPIKFDFDESRKGARVRHLHEVRLWEVSPVTWGANEPAKIAEVNALAEPIDVILERFGEYVQELEINEAIRLLCGPIVSGNRTGELTEAMRAVVSEAIQTLNGLLVVAEPEPSAAPLTQQRQSERLAALAMAEAVFAGGVEHGSRTASPHQSGA